MKSTRRSFLGATTAGALAAASGANVAKTPKVPSQRSVPTPVTTPNGSTMPFRVVDGAKVFHLVAEPVQHRFAEGLDCACWGYNGQVHGPTFEVVEGDEVRIYVTNRLPVPTTVHWHGLYVPSGMDGVGGLNQRPIEPGETFLYEFTLRQHGTFMYHSHHDEMVQMAMGLMGMFIVHPRASESAGPDRDYVYMLSEWAIEPGMRRPDPNEMTDFNVLTLNGAIYPDTRPMVAKLGERVRIRIGNLSAMDHHPIHIHGTSFKVIETDGGAIEPSAQWPETTVLVPTGSTRTIELIADNPGDWAMHCHMTHHVMTQMGHDIDNLVGVDVSQFDKAVAKHVSKFGELQEEAMSVDLDAEDPTIPRNSVPMLSGLGPHGFITMGGMVTTLKIREELEGDEDPGDYAPPPGTQAETASAEALRRDGIDLG